MTHSIPKQINPSFIKFILDETSPNISIPAVFVQKHLSSGTTPETVVLKDDQRLGKKWTVKTEKIGEKLCLGNGWIDFVNDTKTEVGDLVAFWMTGKSTFKVTVFGPNGNEKNLSTPAVPKTRAEESMIPCIFQKVIKPSHRFNMRFTMDFVKESGIGRHESIMVRNESGREWKIKVLKFSDGRVGLGSGWYNFKNGNQIMEGDICKLKYVHRDEGSSSSTSSFIEVKVVKKLGK